MNDIDRSDITIRINTAIDRLRAINPHINNAKNVSTNNGQKGRKGELQKVLIANRGEIAKRFFLALHEEGITSVAVVTDPDQGQSWYDFADEVVFIGDHTHYSDPYVIIAAAKLIDANAVYSGYGFLSENSGFVRIIDTLNRTSGKKIIFMGPGFGAMNIMGDKGNARRIALGNGIPLFESSGIFTSKDIAAIAEEAGRIGYPVILKPAAGGGGKGMFAVYSERELESAVDSTIRTSSALFNNESFYIERYIRKPVHIEVQVFNGWVIGIRKCAVQRRNQKIIEESGDIFIDESTSRYLISAAEKITEISGYNRNCGAGTVEFLIDQETGEIGFLEMNTRLQVEYAVTDQSLDIDLVKCQIQLYDGRDDEISHLASLDHRVIYRNHAIECRIYAEDPENSYLPSPGIITEMDLPTFNGVRCDFGFKEGDKVLPMYDPMIGKLIVHGKTRGETLIRLERALQELYIKGVKTNIPQLLRIIRHPEFAAGSYNNNFLSDNSDLTPDISENKSDDTAGNTHIIMGAFSEYLRLLKSCITDFIVIARMKSITDAPVTATDTDFTVTYMGESFYIRFLQISLNSFYSFINEEYAGIITLNFAGNQADNIIVRFKERILRLRIDRRPGEIILRIKNDRNKISYYSMNVYADGTVSRSRTETVRSPFQGTVISLCRNLKTGDMVWEGDPVMILSSMKMETTVYAPVDGVISYVIGEKVNPGIKESDSLHDGPAGMSIHEGETLVKIEIGYDVNDDSEIRNIRDDSTAFFNSYFRNNLLPAIVSNPDKYIRMIGGLFDSLIYGYVNRSCFIEIIREIITAIGFAKWKSLITKTMSDVIEKSIVHSAYINRVFSRAVTDEGISCFDELNSIINHARNTELLLTGTFSDTMTGLLRSYDIPESSDITLFTGSAYFESIIFFMNSSRRFISDNPDFIKYLLKILPHIQSTEERRLQLINMYMENEADEENSALAEKIKETILKKLISTGDSVKNGILPGQLKYMDTLKKDNRIKELHFSRIEILERKYDVDCIDSSVPSLPLYRITSHDDKEKFISFALINGSGLEITALYDVIEEAVSCSISLLEPYRDENNGTEYCLHLIITEATISLDAINKTGYLSIDLIRSRINSLSASLKKFSNLSVIIECAAESDRSTAPEMRLLRFYIDMDKAAFEYLPESDSRNPYSIVQNRNRGDQGLFNINKWPVELWAEECFDRNSFEEIKIRTIDYDIPEHRPDTPAGAKIFTGKIKGAEACFFMKDARISGGSTGNIEGLKYVAASYLSILKGVPLYVWNDGAGANIREGVIALNRGAQGFMMNALQTGFTSGKFRSLIKHNPDTELITLFDSINEQFGFSFDLFSGDARPLTLIAVGTGSSAGLDVYGSSQAVLQIMLDSEQSYRVLTGSNVIKSIIGENVSNYEIGGAKRICRLTGIADIMVHDKLHLINTIRKIHGHFYSDMESVTDDLSGSVAPGGGRKVNPSIVLTEEIISQNIDRSEFIELKKGYHQADSVIGGLARIGGERVMIIGTRTHNGLRTDASVIKARELLRIAQRTSSHEIIVFGKEFIQEGTGDINRMAARIDFMNTLQQGGGLRIHIITHPEGLKAYYINNRADIIIFAGGDKRSEVDNHPASRNSAFICGSVDEAFALCRRIINLMRDCGSSPTDNQCGMPSIPGNPSIPFDMITSVIEPVFDSGSFIEFYREMNNADTGPMLITGMAILDGKAVGIVADHPLRKGGAADAYGTEKFRIFTEFLNRRKIPLIMLSNSSGFMPGSQQETLRIQAIGAESLDANILGEIPVVSVVFNQNYGGRLIQAFNRFLRPGIVYLAFADSILAVIGAKVAFDLLNRKKYRMLISEGKYDEAEKLKGDFHSEYLERSRGGADGIKSGLVDWIIPDIKDLREHLIKGLEVARERCREAFGRD